MAVHKLCYATGWGGDEVTSHISNFLAIKIIRSTRYYVQLFGSDWVAVALIYAILYDAFVAAYLNKSQQVTIPQMKFKMHNGSSEECERFGQYGNTFGPLQSTT